VAAQIDTPSGDVSNSWASAATQKTVEGLDLWEPTLAIFEEVNAEWEIIARNASQLYTAANQSSVYEMLTTPECVVEDIDQTLAVSTETYRFLCCHRRRLAPLRRIIFQATSHLTEGATDSLSSLPEEMILNIGFLMDNDRLGYLLTACIDDESILVPEQHVVRALGARLVGGNLLSRYTFVKVNLGSLLGCIQSPFLPDYCKTSQPLDLGDTEIGALVFESNPMFSKCCNDTALAEFDTYRTSATCI
jgi:hypothetical protein